MKSYKDKIQEKEDKKVVLKEEDNIFDPQTYRPGSQLDTNKLLQNNDKSSISVVSQTDQHSNLGKKEQ